MKYKHSILSIVACASLTTVSVSAPAYAQSQSEVYAVKIDEGSAASALNALALQTRHPLLFDYEQLKAIKVLPLEGAFTLQQSLDHILRGSGLSARLSNRDVISISETTIINNNMKEDSMFKGTPRNLMGSASAVILTTLVAMPAAAQTAPVDAYVDEVITVGTRSAKPRSAIDSPVPVDSISADDFNSVGNAADITDNLKALIPSYTATPATGDGSAFVRPTSLRGMAPDQVLVLVNGKRRHRAALVQFFAPAAGNGAHGPDVGMIPNIALKQVDVLRDGAAAQYGSDAIAGVINFVTRTAPEGGEASIQYGQHYEGESSFKLGANVGLPLGEEGFINLSGEYTANDALSRGQQRPVAQALIDAGATGVGSDSPFGDAPFVQSWGRPETSGTRFFLSAGYDIGANAELYAFGNRSDTDGRYRFFYRAPNHSTLNTLVANDGYTGDLLNTGYTPFLDGSQADTSIIVGFKGVTDGEWNYDFSLAHGQNKLDYFLNNTTNPSLGLGTDGAPLKRNFNVGELGQRELNFNADFSKALSDTINLGVGAEWREETFSVSAGEFDSYTGAGSNGMGGIKPQDSGDFARDNVAVYADIEHDLSDALLVQYAARYENFSDFGGTLNGKVAARYRLSDAFTMRGAVSTGFHAPTPGQANIRTTITTFDGATGLQVDEGLVPSSSAAAIAVGGAPLTEETSFNLSLGGTMQLGDSTNLTVDAYSVDVNDRIYRTGDIAVAGSTTGATISFYTNALDVEHKGVDVVLTSKFDWGNSMSTDLSAAMNYNQIEVAGQHAVGGINPVSASTIEDIENNYPSIRGVFTANTQLNDKMNFMARANYYGSHYDERGTIGAATNPSAEIDPTVYFDAELGYDLTDQMSIALGAVNVFDAFINEIDTPNANRQSVGLQYPRRSAANYEGGSWYLRARINY